MSRRVELELSHFRCDACERDFTHAVFVGDTDMATDGLCAASSRETLDVAVAETNAAEWAELGARGSGLIERRLAEVLGRSDFVVTRRRYEDTVTADLKGLSFQEFSKAWKPLRVWLSSPCCTGAEAREVETITLVELEARGGRVLAVGDLCPFVSPPNDT